MASTNQDVHESVSDSDLSSLNSTQSSCTSTTSRKKQIRHRFSSWTFQLTINTNAAALNGERASGSVSIQERQKHLLQHLRSRIANPNIMPHIVTFVEAYFDSSAISCALSEGISISIPLHGFVQTRAHTNCEISTMQAWFPASWSPVPGGLSSNQEFKDNVRRSDDPNNTWAKLSVFGSLSLNNKARGEKRLLVQVFS